MRDIQVIERELLAITSDVQREIADIERSAQALSKALLKRVNSVYGDTRVGDSIRLDLYDFHKGNTDLEQFGKIKVLVIDIARRHVDVNSEHFDRLERNIQFMLDNRLKQCRSIVRKFEILSETCDSATMRIVDNVEGKITVSVRKRMVFWQDASDEWQSLANRVDAVGNVIKNTVDDYSDWDN